MTRFQCLSFVTLAALSLSGCAETATEPQIDEGFPASTMLSADGSNGAILEPITHGWIFCFDGEWGAFPSEDVDVTDPFSWAAGWGNVVTAVPDGFVMTDSPPRDFQRIKPGSHLFQHYGFEGALRVRFEGQAYEGLGHARFNLQLRFANGVPHVEVSVEGEVQDESGNSYHLVCKDVGEGDVYRVHRMKLTQKG